MKNRAVFVAVLAMFVGSALRAEGQVPAGQEQSPSQIEPQICNAYFTQSGQGHFGNRRMLLCPDGYAAYGARLGSGSALSPTHQVTVFVDCCKLPAADILLDEHVQSFGDCPEGFVVTGGAAETLCTSCERALHCTKVNLTRYLLGAAQPGALWGFGATYWQESTLILRGQLPPAVRYGLGRDNRTSWFARGCVGNPVGSVLTGKQTKRCYGLTFRQLFFAGLPGDPPRGTLVPMFPECDDLSDIFAGQPRCNRLFGGATK